MDRRDNTIASVLGGLALAMGVLAFLFYDRDPDRRCKPGHVWVQGVCAVGYRPGPDD